MNAIARSAWGATRSGRRGLGLWGPAVLIGLSVSIALGAITLAVSPAPDPVLLAVVVAATSLPLGVTLGWVLLVDRSSLRGAVDRPEESVEGVWWDRASAGALPDTVAAIGLAAGAISLTGVEVTAVSALVGLWVLVVLDVAVRYLVLRRRA